MSYESSADAGSGIMGLLCCSFIAILIVIMIAGFAFWVWMLVDAIQRKYPQEKENERMMWIIILAGSFALSVYPIAAIVYYFAVKRKYDNLQTTTYVSSVPQQPTITETTSTPDSTNQ